MSRSSMSRFAVCASVMAALVVLLASPVSAEPNTRLKDVATLQGIGSTPLIGYGLVVGLNKTGDRRQTLFSAQSLANMLERFGVSVPASQIKIENIAAVLVTAQLPPFVRPGARLDVIASSIGDARSLQGGTLLPTPLRGINGDIYALAEGPLSLGGFGGGTGGNSVQVNHLTVGRVPAGALVQVGSSTTLGSMDTLALSLNEPDFVTASRIAQAISKEAAVLSFDYDACIRCYCCIEICPHGALTARETRTGRAVRKLLL